MFFFCFFFNTTRLIQTIALQLMTLEMQDCITLRLTLTLSVISTERFQLVIVDEDYQLFWCLLDQSNLL